MGVVGWRVLWGKALQAEGCVLSYEAVALEKCQSLGLRGPENISSIAQIAFIPSSQVLLQVLIIITGNYNFFNLLTLVLTTALLDDRHLSAEPGLRCHKKMPTCECHHVTTTKPMSSAKEPLFLGCRPSANL